MLIDLQNASMTTVFLHILEVQGHSGLNPDFVSAYGYNIPPFVDCHGWPDNAWRGGCPACIAIRAYFLRDEITEEEIVIRYNSYHPHQALDLEWYREAVTKQGAKKKR